MKNEIKRKTIGRIFALIVVGMFIVLALTPSVIGDPCDVWNRDAQNEISPIVLTDEVGIGTADPNAMLHVVGDAIISDSLNVDSGTLYVDDTNHRVGIGDTSPDFKLEVTGSSGSGYFGVTSSSYLDFIIWGIQVSFF